MALEDIAQQRFAPEWDSEDTSARPAAPDLATETETGVVVGLVGGLVMGAAMGGPVGAVIGAVTAGVASGISVAAIERYERLVDERHAQEAGETQPAASIPNLEDVSTTDDHAGEADSQNDFEQPVADQNLTPYPGATSHRDIVSLGPGGPFDTRGDR